MRYNYVLYAVFAAGVAVYLGTQSECDNVAATMAAECGVGDAFKVGQYMFN